ncbi:MAG: CoB--CoM heterodisulfide reductase iron-sulfur subunit B family protein [Syntrophomonadaceae bacterium]|nr:CoB--CoM heterodisulfide reductase iron-sulfur subunit B family protein [Syntrophomonadaceae bacterium]
MKMAYYPGCSLDGSAMEYGLSTKRTAEILGVELVEIEDWNCCGATSGHNTDKLLSLALPARNLAIAEQTGLDVLAPCAACYSRFRNTEHVVRHDPQIREKIENVIEMEYKASNDTLSILELLVNKLGTDKIAAKVTASLKGMKAACYYGCLLVRPREHTGFDDDEDPQSMDKVVQALGAMTVDWPHKTECCGAALATSRPDVGKKMIYEVIKNAKAAGAECMVTACPLCMMNLDMRQAAVEKEYKTDLQMPVYYVTELLAIACGDAPRKVGVERHFVEAESYLASLPAKAAAIEAEEAARAAAKAAKSPKARKAAADEGASAPATAETAGGPAAAAKPAAAPEGASPDGDLEKKINAMIKGLQKNPEKMALKLIADEERAAILAEIIKSDEKKVAKLAELMISDKDKAGKAADAYVAGELKKRAK